MSAEKRVDTNTAWSNRIDQIVNEVKKKAMQPNFTGSVSLELHASEGMIKKVVEGGAKHYSLARD